VDATIAKTSVSLDPVKPISLHIPDDIARGLYLVELTLVGSEGVLSPSTPRGRAMGTLHVGAIRIPEGPSLIPGPTATAAFEDLQLLEVDVVQPNAAELRLRMHWSTPGTPRNWSFSLRVLDLDGRPIVQRDLQPGYGYLPTTMWHPGEQIVDTVALPLPEGLAPGDYTLRVITYLQATMQDGGEVDIPIRIDKPTVRPIRDACCELVRRGATILCQTDELALLGLEMSSSIREGEDLGFTAEWNALRAPTEDVRAAWTLVTTSGDIVRASDAPLAVGSRTSDWPEDAYVVSPQHIDLPQQLAAGPSELHLALEGSNSGVTVCGRVAVIDVLPRPRAFVLPTPTHPQVAGFGDSLVLLGYDLVLAPLDAGLSLTLWWQANQIPASDYKRFVHLYSPEAEVIAAQDDAMPRDWAYPTSLWAAGEVVSETIELDLAGVSLGAYSLGVGWYDPATTTRLAVTAADPSSIQSDRLTLDTGITVRR
jgi:hypothetical protein